MDDRVVVRDVVLRDGLQDEPVVVSLAGRVRIAEALIAAGVTSIEAASFVNPARVPQMAGAEELVALLRPRADGVTVSGLALNGAGVRRGVASGIDEVQLVVSAAEGHSRANAGRGVTDVLAGFAGAVAEPEDVVFTAAVATAFNCPFDGEVPATRLVEEVGVVTGIDIDRLHLAVEVVRGEVGEATGL